jgi:hypothetical protein
MEPDECEQPGEDARCVHDVEDGVGVIAVQRAEREVRKVIAGTEARAVKAEPCEAAAAQHRIENAQRDVLLVAIGKAVPVHEWNAAREICEREKRE